MDDISKLIDFCQRETEFPEGVYEKNGVLMYTCRSCEQSIVLEVDLDEYDYESAYCGGSPRCLP